jgi:hypothetical protein
MTDSSPRSATNEIKVKEAHEAFVHWQEVTSTQLGHTINLVLTLTTAAVGFAINLVLGRRTPPLSLDRCAFFWSLISLISAVLIGLAANYCRMLDFRWTTRAARGREMHARSELREALSEKQLARAQDREKYSNCAEAFGKVTWRLLFFQLLSFLLGVALLALAVRSSYWPA